MDTDVDIALRRLLQGKDSFTAVRLLLETGHLNSEVHEAWLDGDLASLDGMFFEGKGRVRELLGEVKVRALEYGLTIETGDHRSRNGGGEIKASRDSDFNALLATSYRRVSRAQYDLFLDTASVRTENALRDALLALDPYGARKAVTDMEQMDHEYGRLADARLLVEVLEGPMPDGPEQAAEYMAALQRDWLRAADAVLGTARHRLTDYLWRGIARAMDGADFDPACPELHASWAYGQCLDWENVRRSVRAVPGHGDEPVLLERLAVAECRMGNRDTAMGYWFSLCWKAPDTFEKSMDASGFPDQTVVAAWHRAQAEASEPEISAEWFPPWMLLEETALAGRIDVRGGEDGPGRAYRAVVSLLVEGDSIDLRRALAMEHRGLLERYKAGLR